MQQCFPHKDLSAAGGGGGPEQQISGRQTEKLGEKAFIKSMIVLIGSRERFSLFLCLPLSLSLSLCQDDHTFKLEREKERDI